MGTHECLAHQQFSAWCCMSKQECRTSEKYHQKATQFKQSWQRSELSPSLKQTHWCNVMPTEYSKLWIIISCSIWGALQGWTCCSPILTLPLAIHIWATEETPQTMAANCFVRTSLDTLWEHCLGEAADIATNLLYGHPNKVTDSWQNAKTFAAKDQPD